MADRPSATENTGSTLFDGLLSLTGQAVWNHLKNNPWISSHSGPATQEQEWVTTRSAGSDSVKDYAVKYAISKAGRPLDDAAAKRLAQTGLGREMLEKAGVATLKELEEKVGKEAVEKGTKALAGTVGEKGAKILAEKGLGFLMKKAARCIPGIGLVTGGAIEYYEFCQEWKEMRQQYGEATSQWLKENKGIDIAPEDIKDKHLKIYAEANPIIRNEINAMRADMTARTATGAFGIFGMAAELGYDAVDMALGARSAHEIMDDMAAMQKKNRPLTKEDVLEMVDSAFSGEKGKTTRNLPPEQKAAFEAVAEQYAQKLNSGELSAYDMLHEVGDGKFHAFARARQEIGHCHDQIQAAAGTGRGRSDSTFKTEELPVTGLQNCSLTADVGDAEITCSGAPARSKDKTVYIQS